MRRGDGKLFSHAPEVFSRTMQFVDRCNLKLTKVDNPFPDFAVPKGKPSTATSKRSAAKAFEAPRHRHPPPARPRPAAQDHRRIRSPAGARDRLHQADEVSRLLHDRLGLHPVRPRADIPVGPGRGSAAGSLVAYVMEITDIDPLQNELLFERFLNPERVSMPDIDIDFCMNRRGEVIDYVTRKYGSDQVAQIITFNTMAAKAAIKDVGRALDMPYGEVDRIAKMIPATIGITIDQALEGLARMQDAYDKDPKIKELIDTARLEGLVRGAGVHAAGVVIAPKPLTELVPVTRSKNDDIVTAYDMKAVEKMGLLKMDFLGLTTLTVIDDASSSSTQARQQSRSGD